MSDSEVVVTPHDERQMQAGAMKLSPEEQAIVDSGEAFKFDGQGRVVSLGGNRAERREAAREQRSWRKRGRGAKMTPRKPVRR